MSENNVTTTTQTQGTGQSRGEMITLSREELQGLIAGAVEEALRKRDLEEKGETKQGDKIVFTSQALKERLDRARAAERRKIAEAVGVSEDKLDEWLKQAKDAIQKVQEMEKEQVSEEEVKAFESELRKALDEAGVKDEARKDALVRYFVGWAERTEDLGDDPIKTFVGHVQKDLAWMIQQPQEQSKEEAQAQEPKEELKPEEPKEKATTGNKESAEPKEGAKTPSNEVDVRDPKKVPKEEFERKLRELGVDLSELV